MEFRSADERSFVEMTFNQTHDVPTGKEAHFRSYITPASSLNNNGDSPHNYEMMVLLESGDYIMLHWSEQVIEFED